VRSGLFERSFGEWGVSPQVFPNGHGEVPFAWDCRGKSFAIRLAGGLIGVRQDPDTLSLKPEIGWAVCPGA
jgi:hypothetical protein